MPPHEQVIFFPIVLPGWNESVGQAKRRFGRSNGYAQLKKTLENQLRLYIRSNHLVPMKEAWLKFLWREMDKRRDPDNIISAKKYILDALVAEKIISNDGQTVIKGLKDSWTVNSRDPGVLVTLKQEE